MQTIRTYIIIVKYNKFKIIQLTTCRERERETERERKGCKRPDVSGHQACAAEPLGGLKRETTIK